VRQQRFSRISFGLAWLLNVPVWRSVVGGITLGNLVTMQSLILRSLPPDWWRGTNSKRQCLQ